MSVEAMTWVLNHSKTTLGARLVLLIIANHAEADGSDSWPGVATIARKANLSEGAARRAIRRCEELGELVTEPQAGGNRETRSDRRPNRYRVVMDGGALPTPRCPDGGAKRTPRGREAHADGGALPTPYTSLEPSLEPSKDVGDLCELLAERVGTFAGTATKVTSAWARDMDLLLRRGPTTWATPKPLTAENVRRCIAFVFDECAEPEWRNGGCWAANIRSPGKLREKWDQLVVAARAKHQRGRPPSTGGLHRGGLSEDTMARAMAAEEFLNDERKALTT